jgi:Tfp pilus assembly protein PilF
MLIFACAISLPAMAQLPSSMGSFGVGRRGRYMISGTVRMADGSFPAGAVQVKLWSLSGMTANTFTNSSGVFTFMDVPRGTYYLIVEERGYQRVQQEVNFTSHPAVDLQLLLRPLGPPSEKVGEGPTVSARELAIPRRAREAMQRGLELLRNKSDYKGSITEFQRAVHEYSDYYEAYTQMGIAYMRMGDPAMAEQMLNTSVVMSHRNYSDALFYLASLYTNQKRFADAEPLAHEAVTLDPISWEAHIELARALHGLGQSEQAEASALDAQRIQPDNPETYLVLANIHLKMAHYQALIDDLDKYLELQPNGPQADQARRMREQVYEALARRQSPAQ